MVTLAFHIQVASVCVFYKMMFLSELQQLLQ